MGAARNLGFSPLKDDEIAVHISENTGIPLAFVQDMLANTPSIKARLENVYLGITEEMERAYKPDYYIVYTNPLKIMCLINDLSRKQKKRPLITPYSLLSICGNVFARSYHSGAICISFACPESRKYGGVGKNEVVVGFPEARLHELMD
jgi:uncharacterized protein (DUF169 family)